MLKKKSWMKWLTAVAIGLTVGSCSKVTGSTPEQEFVDNFKALVMGGKEIDSLQDWSTSGSMSVKIGVDLGTASEYSVYILPTPALYDKDAAFWGMAKVKSGETKTITIARPASNALLYAACYDEDGHAVCQPFFAKASGTEVSFNGMSPASIGDSDADPGDSWYVPMRLMPDLSEYINGPFTEVSTLEGEPVGDDLLRLSISSDYTGYLPSLGIRGKMILYVTSTWTLSFNQRVAKGNILIVGSGGKIVIPEGMSLTASDVGGGSGQIYVMTGGEITGNGTLNLSLGNGNTSYNAGTIDPQNVILAGTTLANNGVLGNSSSMTTTLTCMTDDEGEGGMLINWGRAWLKQFGGESAFLQNASYMNVSDMTLNASSRLADLSYLHCSSLALNGLADGSCVLHMGNAATLEADAVSIDNFGVWGPSGRHFVANAILKIGNCSLCNTTDGVAGTYLLDHVELLLPTSFSMTYDQENMTANTRLTHYWMNAYEGRLFQENSYQWVLIDGKEMRVWNEAVSSCACGDTSRQTCTYSQSPSFDTSYDKKGIYDIPFPNGVYYAFEIAESSQKDYDYNDVVLRVSTPVDQGDGTYVSNVQLMCVGTTFKTVVLYNGEPLGGEVHSEIGVPETSNANASTINRVFAKLGELTFTNANARIDQLNFSLSVTSDNSDKTTILEMGDTPLFLVINGHSDRRWFWTKEGVNIGVAYQQFSTWASNMQTAINWYDNANAISGKVVTWTKNDE